MAARTAPVKYRVSEKDASKIKRTAFFLDLFGVIPGIGDVGKQFGWFYLNRFFKKRGVDFAKKQFTPGKIVKKVLGELAGVVILYWPGMSISVKQTLKDANREDKKKHETNIAQQQQEARNEQARQEYDQRYKRGSSTTTSTEESGDDSSENTTQDQGNVSDDVSRAGQRSEIDTPALEREDETEGILDDQKDYSNIREYASDESHDIDRPYSRGRQPYKNRHRAESPTERQRAQREKRRRSRRGKTRTDEAIDPQTVTTNPDELIEDQGSITEVEKVASSAQQTSSTGESIDKDAVETESLRKSEMDTQQADSPEKQSVSESEIPITSPQAHGESALEDSVSSEKSDDVESQNSEAELLILPGEEVIVNDADFISIYHTIGEQLIEQESSILKQSQEVVEDVLASLALQEFTRLFPQKARAAKAKGWKSFISKASAKRLMRQFKSREDNSLLSEMSPSYKPTAQSTSASQSTNRSTSSQRSTTGSKARSTISHVSGENIPDPFENVDEMPVQTTIPATSPTAKTRRSQNAQSSNRVEKIDSENSSVASVVPNEINVTDLGINTFTQESGEIPSRTSIALTRRKKGRLSRRNVSREETERQYTPSFRDNDSEEENNEGYTPPHRKDTHDMIDPFDSIAERREIMQAARTEEEEPDIEDEESMSNNVSSNRYKVSSTLRPYTEGVAKPYRDTRNIPSLSNFSSTSITTPANTPSNNDENNELEEKRASQQKIEQDKQKVLTLKGKGILVDEQIEFFEEALKTNSLPANLRGTPEFKKLEELSSSRGTDFEKYMILAKALRKHPNLQKQWRQFEQEIVLNEQERKWGGNSDMGRKRRIHEIWRENKSKYNKEL